MRTLANAIRWGKAFPHAWRLANGMTRMGRLLLKFNPGCSSVVDVAIEQMQRKHCRT